MIWDKICLNCEKVFTPSKNDERIKFCNKICRTEYRKKNKYTTNWHKENKDKVKQYREKTRDKRNARRRELYQNDEKYRKKIKKQNREFRKRNPTYKRDNDLRYKYGITYNDFLKMREDQKKKCKICGDEFKNTEDLYVDHCHESGKVRGLLCNNCNFGIGHFKDDTQLLEKAIRYLKGVD